MSDGEGIFLKWKWVFGDCLYCANTVFIFLLIAITAVEFVAFLSNKDNEPPMCVVWCLALTPINIMVVLMLPEIFAIIIILIILSEIGERIQKLKPN